MKLDVETRFPTISTSNYINKLSKIGEMGLVMTLSQFFITPFERAKLLMQTRDSLNRLGKKIPTNSVACLSKIIKEQGTLAIWQGTRITVQKNIFQTGVQAWMYNACRKISFPNGEANYTGTDRVLRRIWAAFNCGSFTMAQLYPLEQFRVQASCEIRSNKKDLKYNRISKAFSHNKAAHGYMGQYRGFTFSLATSVMFITASLTIFDELLMRKNMIRTYQGNECLERDDNTCLQYGNLLVKYIEVPALASLLANAVQYPFDTLRRRYQIQGFEGVRPVYTNSYRLITGILQKDGVRSLYNGFWISVLKTMVVLSSQYFVRENIEQLKELDLVQEQNI